MELFQQVPDGFDILIVVGDIGIIHIDPVAHLFSEIFPHTGVLHHILAACCIEFFNGNFCPDILLGNVLGALNGQFHGQTMGIPARFPLHQVSLLCFIPAEDILDGTGHHMVNTGFSIG